MNAERRYYGLALTVITLLLCAKTVMTGAVPQQIHAHDCPLLYDGAWRVYNGFVPHVDFYSSLGPFTYLYLALGYWVFGVSVHALAYMNAVALAVLVLLTWTLLRGRMPDFWLFWACLLVGLCAMAPFPIRNPPSLLSYALFYNRQGYAMMMLLSLLLYAPMANISTRRLAASMCVAGVLLSAMLFCKVSFFVASVPMVAAFWYFERERPWERLAWGAAGFAVPSLLFLTYLRFDLAGMYGDLSMTAKAKTSYLSLHWHDFIATAIEQIAPNLLCVLVILFGWIFLATGNAAGDDAGQAAPAKPSVRPLLHEMSLLVLLAGCTMFAVFTCSIGGLALDYPLLASTALVLCARHSPSDRVPSTLWPGMRKQWAYLAMVAVTAYASLPSIWTYGESVVRTPPVPPDNLLRFNSPNVADILFYPDQWRPLYVTMTNDAVNLIAKHRIQGKSMLAFEYTQFFAFATRSPSVGGSPFVEANVTVSPEAYPPAERYIAGVDYIFFPKFPSTRATVNILYKAYAEYVWQRYRPLDESDYWTLWVRNDLAPPQDAR
ncbi:hypothetical protein DB346_04595 [Verrucomicrobia bacterium LW23]|nr:hypothetical protein DB346_04595 [Verrucomicrobia bacterium LW23]